MEVSVSGVAPSSYKLCSSALGFVSALKAALADGWQADKDLPELLKQALAALIPAVSELHDAAAEVKSDPQGVIKALLLSGLEAYGLMK